MSYLGTVEYIFFSSTHRIFSRIDYVGGHKRASKNLKGEIIQSMFSDHNGIKLIERNLRFHKYAKILITQFK